MDVNLLLFCCEASEIPLVCILGDLSEVIKNGYASLLMEDSDLDQY